MNKKLIQVMLPGTFTDVHGTPVTLTAEDLKASAAAYDTAKHEAPFVIGHPKVTDAAYGWAAAVHFSETNGLEVEAIQVDPDFAEMHNAGRYKKRSASFYRPDSSENPVPGVWYLRHIGFLGAQPPSVKGLRSVEFGEGGEGVADLAEWDVRVITETNVRLWRALRDWMIEQRGVEAADRTVPEWMINSMQEIAQRDPEVYNNATAAFAEFQANQPAPEPSAREKELQAELDQIRQERETAAEQARIAEHNARQADQVSFAEGLIEAGRIKPKHKDAVVAALVELSAPTSDAGVVEFGEGDARLPLLPALREFLTDLPPVDFSEKAKKTRVKKPDNTHPLIADAERRHNR